MADAQSTLATFYQGWRTYQDKLVDSLTPLSAEQLALRPAPQLRSLGETVLHIVGARGRWLHDMLGEGDPEFADLGTWDRPGMPTRSAADLVAALGLSWRVMQEAIARWTPAEWAQRYDGDPGEESASFDRRWVIWHLIEHDLHHGGEVFLTLGLHGLVAPDL